MNCPFCGAPLTSGQDRCVHCGSDVRTFRRIKNCAVICYNIGLEKAKVRDLSGAAEYLEKSLEYDKSNIMARNLLGLVYFEMDEVVKALREWVISKNLDPSAENLAGTYIDELQAHQSYLHEVDELTKRYNNALELAKQGNDDLAVIQLRRIFASNPRCIRSGQLLALLYLKHDERQKAEKVLRKILAADVNNTKALRYMQELKDLEESERDKDSDEPRVIDDAVPMKIKGGRFEDKPSIFVFLNLLIGIGVGLAIFAVLILPTIRQKQAQNANNAVANLSSQMTEKDAQITEKASEIDNLNEQISNLQGQIDTYEKDSKDTATAAEGLAGLLKAANAYASGEKELTVAEDLVSLDMTKVTDTNAQTLYKTLLAKTRDVAVAALYTQGVEQEYNNGSFQAALETFKKIISLQPDNLDAIYYCGRTEERLGDTSAAKTYYQQLIKDHAGTDQATKAQARLDALNGQ